ncbi:hypothetical protein ACQ7B2_19555, partial [Escherichia coli]
AVLTSYSGKIASEGQAEISNSNPRHAGDNAGRTVALGEEGATFGIKYPHLYRIDSRNAVNQLSFN